MKNRGFTIIEMLVSLAVFTAVTAIASGLLVSGLQAQRRGLAQQQLLDQTSFLMEHISRTARMAKKDMSGACTGTAKANYGFAAQCLKFLYHESTGDVCQQFCLEGTRLKDESSRYFTSPELQISSFNVIISGQSQYDSIQPSAKIFLNITGKEQANIKIQTTISQRNLDVEQ